MSINFLVFLSALFNLGIAAGYAFVAVFVAPELRIEDKRTRWGGILFFTTCGLTHADLGVHALLREEMGLEDFASAWHLGVHFVQVLSVWVFVTGLYREILQGKIEWPIRLRRRD